MVCEPRFVTRLRYEPRFCAASPKPHLPPVRPLPELASGMVQGKQGSLRKIRLFCRFAAFLPPFEQNDPRPEFLCLQSEIPRCARNDRLSITSSIQSPGGLPRNLTLRTRAEAAQVIEGIDT